MVNRTRFTLGQAALEVGKSKSAISKAISDGRLSATKNPNGSYSIDAAELFRVYESIQVNVNHGQPVNSELFQKLLEKEVEERRNERALLQATIDDLRKRLDTEQETVKRLTFMLEHQTELVTTKEAPVKSWLDRLLR